MNKGLVKELEGIGFVLTACGDRLELELRYGFSVDYNIKKDMLFVYKDDEYINGIKADSVLIGFTFTEHLSFIKKHTGQDLTPKLTKRQEIEALKVCMTKLEDALEAKNEAVDKNTAAIIANKCEMKARGQFNCGAISVGMDFGTHSADATAYSVVYLHKPTKEVTADKKPTIIKESVFEHGTGESRKVSLHGLESTEKPKKYATIIGTDPRYPLEIGDRVKVVKESNIGAMVSRVDSRQTFFYNYNDLKFDEVKEEKKPFEVGDSVVKVGKGDYFCGGSLLRITSEKTDHNHYECQSIVMPSVKKYVHESQLLHAPKAEQKEKALVFGAMMECIGVYDCLSKGQEVVFLAHSKEEKGNFDVIDEYANHYCVPSSYLKPL